MGIKNTIKNIKYSFKQAIDDLEKTLKVSDKGMSPREKSNIAILKETNYDIAQRSFSQLSKETQDKILDSNILQRDFYNHSKRNVVSAATQEASSTALKIFDRKSSEALNRKLDTLKITDTKERDRVKRWLEKTHESPEYTHDMIKKSNNIRLPRIRADKADIEYELMEKKYPHITPSKAQTNTSSSSTNATTESEDPNSQQGFFRRHWKATAAVGGTVGTGLLAAVGIANMMMSQGGQLSNSNLYNPEQQT